MLRCVQIECASPHIAMRALERVMIDDVVITVGKNRTN
jgi:hypothetical protein